mmetsp:Transcript_21529/g.47327  ORF Transcript_21529/g.47327 Transcript_21529/m.47327 type:complete len:394 (+) Transcript_21529:173-1354(+)
MEVKLGRWSERLLLCMVSIVGVYAAVQLMASLRTILQPLLFAVFLVMWLLPASEGLKYCFVRFLCCRPRQETGEEEGIAERIAGAAAVTIVMAAVLACVLLVGFMVLQSVMEMHQHFSIYHKGAMDLVNDIHTLLAKLSESLHLGDATANKMTEDMVTGIQRGVLELVTGFIADFSDTLVRGVLTLLYLLFWLCQPIPVHAAVDSLFRKYILMKTIANLCMGVSVGMLLYMLGVGMPWMFGLAAFLLNYIPEIGPLICTCLPLPIILLDSRNTVGRRLAVGLMYVVGCLLFKFVFGNVLELKLIEQDKKMRMHPVVVLFGVAFFGYVWGPTGMLLSVPLLALVKVVVLSSGTAIPTEVKHAVLVFLEGDPKAASRYCEMAPEYGSMEGQKSPA